jgi:hypothetical protein
MAGFDMKPTIKLGGSLSDFGIALSQNRSSDEGESADQIGDSYFFNKGGQGWSKTTATKSY